MNIDTARMINIARGGEVVDLLLKNVQLVNVLSGEIYRTDVAIHRSLIVGFGDYRARETFNLKGLYLAPGFIDGHIHLESTMLTPAEFTRTVLPLGTTSVVCDPHELANVLGAAGITYFLNENKTVPLALYVMLPSCVPATPLETSGANLEADELRPLLSGPYVLGLAEVMNYPGVLAGDKDLLNKIQLVYPVRSGGINFVRRDKVSYDTSNGAGGKVIDGHAPGLKDKNLSAYVISGITSDHESVTAVEAREKLRAGMYLMIREGSAAKNMAELLKVVTPHNSRRCLLVSDDRHPADLLSEGHLNHLVRKAIRLGLSPVNALQMVTLNTAEYFRLRYLGAIAPGYQADLVALDNFRNLKVKFVWKAGRLVAKNGAVAGNLIPASSFSRQNTIHIKSVHYKSFRIPQAGKYIRVMELIPRQIITRQSFHLPLVRDGECCSDLKRDILKIAVIERHHATGNIGLGFVRGFGLSKGAIGSSVAHDSHNLIIVGTNDKDMLTAAQHLVSLGGGLVVVSDGKINADLPLPFAGLISDRPVTEIARSVHQIHQATRALGCRLPDPFMTLSFLALAPIPELKITDKGLVDVSRFQIVSLFTNQSETARLNTPKTASSES